MCIDTCIVGYAGAGKTTTLKVAQQLWKAQGFQVMGLAPTGRATQNLEESGIKPQTLHRFLYQFEQGRYQLNPKTVLVLDEAGMVDMRRMERFLQAVETLGVKAVVVGDGAQLQAVEAGDAFRLITRQVEAFYLQDVRRQEQDWQREATKAFGRLETESALKMYLDKGQVTFVEERVLEVEKLVEAGDIKGLVSLYNLAHRMVGRSHSMAGIHSRIGQTDAAQRRDAWLYIKTHCALEMVAHLDTGYLDTCRSYMKALGTSPLVFAENFVEGKNREERLPKAMKLAERWRLPILNPNQPRHICDSRDATRAALVAAWGQSMEEKPEDSHLILAYTSKDVQALNQDTRRLMRARGQIQGAEFTYTTERQVKDPLVGGSLKRECVREEQKSFAVGDRLLFCKNENGLGVKNGMIGTVEALSPSSLTVKLLSSGGEERRMTFSPHLYKSFDHGWAVTVHKSQGVTVDRVFKLASFEEYRNLAYVGMTRHRKEVQVFGSTLDFWSKEVFLNRLSSSQDKSLAHDYGGEAELSQKLESARHNKLLSMLEKIGNRLDAMGFVAKHITQKTIDAFLTPRELSEVPHEAAPLTKDMPVRQDMPVWQDFSVSFQKAKEEALQLQGVNRLKDPGAFAVHIAEHKLFLQEEGTSLSQKDLTHNLKAAHYAENIFSERLQIIHEKWASIHGNKPLSPLQWRTLQEEAQRITQIEARLYGEALARKESIQEYDLYVGAKEQYEQNPYHPSVSLFVQIII